MSPNSHKRPKATFMWRVRDWFERLFERIGKGLGNLAESFEWMMANLGTVLLPWNWFRRSDSDEFAEFPREQGQRSWAESFEFLFHWLFSTIAFVVMPWRWFGPRDRTLQEETLGERSGSISERSEWIVGTFLEKVGDVFRLLGQILVPRQVVETTENVQRSLTQSTLKTSYRIEKWIAKFADRFLPRQIFWPLYWLGRQCLDAFDFVSEWWWSREYAKLTWAAPALLLFVPISVSVVLGFWNNESRKIRHYQQELALAQEAEDDERSFLLKRRLEQLGFQRLNLVEFRAGLELAAKDQFKEAYEKIKPVAPEEEPGLLQGHLWIASQLLRGNVRPTNDDGSPKDLWGEFEIHVEHALSQEPRNPWALRYRIELLLHRQRWADAIEQMELLVDEFPDFHATLAHTYNRVGNEAKSRLHAKRAIAYYARLVATVGEVSDESQPTGEPSLDVVSGQVVSDQDTENATSTSVNSELTASELTASDLAASELTASDLSTSKLVKSAPVGSTQHPTAAPSSEVASVDAISSSSEVPLTPLGFLRMSQVFSLVDEGDQALELLAKGVEAFPNHQEIREEFNETRLARLRQYEFADPRMQDLMVSICRDDPENELMVRTLVRGLLAKENSKGLARVGLNRLAIVDRNPVQAAEAAEQILQHLLKQDLLSAKVYLRLGNYYLVDGNYRAAAKYYQNCCKLQPDAGDAWNNLAWLLATDSINDLDNALRASNRAIAVDPNARYLETRGQIYAKLKRWQEAATDLEVAISGGVLNGNKARESLADCYSALGFEEQAEAHRRMLRQARRGVSF